MLGTAILGLGLAMSMVTPAGTIAGGPKNEPAPLELGDTGPADEEDAAIAAAKSIDFQAWLTLQQPTLGIETVSPSVICPQAVGDCDPAGDKVLSFTKYHQKTTNYCLPASIQSILQSKFGGYAGSTVKAMQDTIFASTGTNSGLGRSYINQQIASKGADWAYVSISVTSWQHLWSLIVYDVANYNWPTWVRVDWNSEYWPSHGSGGPTGHASVSYGYYSAAIQVPVYDPWTYVKSDGSCYIGPGYSASPDKACSYRMTAQDYYSAYMGPAWY